MTIRAFRGHFSPEHHHGDRARRDLLALRRRHVDRRVRDRLSSLDAMRNPFRSEADAFRFVWLTIGYFALIVVASLINRVARRCRLRRPDRRSSRGGSSRSGERERAARSRCRRRARPTSTGSSSSANETVGGPELLSEISERARRPARTRARRLPGAQLAAPPLGSRRGRGARRGAGSGSSEPRVDARGRARGRGRDRRRRPDPGDRGRHAHVPARRADHLDASRRPVALARARRRREGARAASTSR